MNKNKDLILDFNKKCALFWGYKIHKADPWYKINGYKEHYFIENHNHPFFGNKTDRKVLSQMRFDSDWNWLMSVSNKIEKSGFRKYLSSTEESTVCVFTDMSIKKQNHNFGGGYIVASSDKCDNEKEALIQAIDRFIDWYNTTNTYTSKLDISEVRDDSLYEGDLNEMGDEFTERVVDRFSRIRNRNTLSSFL